MKILLADRSKQIRDRVEKLIFGIIEDVTILHTDSNLDAIKLVNEHRPEIILLDIDLNDGSGFKILSKVRTAKYHPVKIVFTNHIKNNIKDVSYRLGADYFLNKSHDFIEIKRIISRLKKRSSRIN